LFAIKEESPVNDEGHEIDLNGLAMLSEVPCGGSIDWSGSLVLRDKTRGSNPKEDQQQADQMKFCGDWRRSCDRRRFEGFAGEHQQLTFFWIHGERRGLLVHTRCYVTAADGVLNQFNVGQ
jgi:hypothetical protein